MEINFPPAWQQNLAADVKEAKGDKQDIAVCSNTATRSFPGALEIQFSSTGTYKFQVAS